jgi:hypothetical protein
MKRNLLLLAVMIWVAFGFSLAYGAQDPNDNGVADTLYLEVWQGDDSLFLPGPWDVKYNLRVTNDIPNPVTDSIAGFVIPLCYTSSNGLANATLANGHNNCGAADLEPFPAAILENSCFRHMPTYAIAAEHNWMMDLSAAFMGGDWDTRILDITLGNNAWISLVPTGTQDQRFKGGSRVLIFTLTFTIEDSTNICLDTCFWPPTGRLAFSRSDAVTYVPQIWDDYYGQEYVCVEHFIVPNIPPRFNDGVEDQSHNANTIGHSTDDFEVEDLDGTIASVTASAAPPGIANLSVVMNVAEIKGGHVEYDVTDHCAAGGTVTLTVMDDGGATATDDFLITLTNAAPEVTCPGDATVKYCDGFTGQATATDANGDGVEFSGDAAADGSMDFTYTCQDVGQHTYTVIGTDDCDATDQCQFTVTVTNAAPTITCPDDAIVTAGAGFMSTAFSFTDDCPGAVVTVQGVSPAAEPPADYGITGNQVFWNTSVDDEGVYTFTLRVTDECGLYAECTFDVEVVSYGFSNIFIPNSDCVNPGEYVCLPILLDNNTTPFGGFEITVEFDYTSMTFVGAEPCAAIEGFEEFTYRLLPCPLCGCCKYKILLFGMYDLPNGVANIGDPIPMTPAGVYQCLVELCFVVNNNENLRGLKIPVCFEWEGTIDPQTGCLVEDWNCGENTFSSWSGDTLYGSMLCCQFDPDLCDFTNPRVDQKLIFQWGVCGQNCGGVDVCAAGPGACKRGDINYNTITYEVADAVLFASYFVQGTSVFRYDMAYQICATDVNADGRTLTLSDLVYLIRVILHDAVEMPKLTPSSDIANVIVYNGTISTECASPIGAILFEFDSAVNPTLLADMEMVTKDNKVLVWSSAGNTFSNAEVLSVDAELVSVTAVDRDSRELETTITAKVAPSSFALHAAYPNPFNPFTNLSFNLPEAMSYSLRIYNVAGQLVRTLDGVGSQNLNVVTWDGKDNSGSEVSSGVYFYKLTAAGFSATEKMVMMK